MPNSWNQPEYQRAPHNPALTIIDEGLPNRPGPQEGVALGRARRRNSANRLADSDASPVKAASAAPSGAAFLCQRTSKHPGCAKFCHGWAFLFRNRRTP